MYYLQRQGVGGTVKLNHPQFYAEAHQINTRYVKKGKGFKSVPSAPWYQVEIQQSYQDGKFTAWKSIYAPRQVTPENCPTNLAEVAAFIKAKVKECLDVDVEIATEVKAYMYYTDADRRIWPYISDDVFVNWQAVYEQSTNTIRKYPENYCLIAWEGGDITKPNFNVDAATVEYRHIIEKAHAEFTKNINQRKSDRENKEWLAWLISEWLIEEGFATDHNRTKKVAC